MTTVYLALGSNLEGPEVQIARAVELLGAVEGLQLKRRAPLYRSAPLGPSDQPRYVNTVIEAETRLPALGLLDATQRIERDMGRKKTIRWGPRIIDIDIVLFGGAVLRHSRLTVPHAGMHERRFVLQPLAALEPDLEIPGRDETVSKALDALQKSDDAIDCFDDEIRDLS